MADVRDQEGDKVRVMKVDYRLAVDAFTGSASIEIPVPTTPARVLTPALVLTGSGAGGGNSVVGRGWSLGGLPAITVDTSEHLPRWDGRDGVAFGGAPLVPWRDAEGAVRRRVLGEYRVTDLRPRAGFTRARVEEWRHTGTGDVHYRSRDEADVLTIYGARPGGAARLVDPDEASRVAAWLPEVVIDPVGNAMWFEYAAEDARGVDRAAPWEPRHPCTAQRYLRRVRYGNVAPIEATPAVCAGVLPDVRFAFALVIDYGDHGADGTVPTFAADRDWPARTDVVATARDGFAVRTYRRVRRLACFHHVDALGVDPVAVSALELGYDDAPAGSQLRTVRRVGYRDGAVATSAALTVTYAAAGVADEVAVTTAGVAAPRQQLVDLYGEGLPGVLFQGERGWLYRANRGGGAFAEPTLVEAQPSFERGVTLLDRDRDGDTELAVTAGAMTGSFALEREDARWRGFRPFARWPRIEGLVGRTFWVDLNGDGRTDAVIARGESLVWFPSRTGPLDEGDAEFDDPVTLTMPQGAERAPGANPDPLLDLGFADIDGDGLPDLVRVRRGTIEYWPSLGNGRFGDRVAMDAVPALAALADFDSRRVRWVDLDGSGTADLIYLGDGEVWCCPNLGGRRFGAAERVRGLPQFDARAASIADVAGDGRAALVWPSLDLGRAATLSYLPLTPVVAAGSVVEVADGCGRVTALQWGNSASHYLRDAADGVPWETRLPGHRPVVDELVEYDLIGGTRVATRYRYRDGYYDGNTGAFRGFGRVETLDTPTMQRPGTSGPGDGGPSDAAVAPLLTRTWFHLGTPMWNHHRPFEPYVGDPLAPSLPAHAEATGPRVPADSSAALRLLAGAVVRRERWAVDHDERPVEHPFDVEQASYQLAELQPRRGEARPVFGQLARERLTAAYDGAAGDPRVTHEVVVAFDQWGTPTRTATIAYARRGVTDDVAQARTWITVTDSVRAQVDDPGQFVLGVEIEAQRYELVGVASSAGRITPAALADAAVTATLAAPELFEDALDPEASTPAARRLAWKRTYYWSDAFVGVAAFGTFGGAPRRHHVDEACLTPGLVEAALDTRIDSTGLAALGYVLADAHLWAATPIEQYGGTFALPSGTQRADGATTSIGYDDDQLVPVETTDPLGLDTALTVDYRVLGPAVVVDPNGTAGESMYEPLGRVCATGVVGQLSSNAWLTGTAVDWQSPAVASAADVLADPASFLGDAATATFFDDRAWERDGAPVAEVTIARAVLMNDGAGGGDANSPLEARVRYLDGFGRVLQEKVRVEAGLAITRDVAGGIVVDGGGRPVLTAAATRWRVSGHVVYDAKGQPVRVYEPYFSPSAAYESDAELAAFGVSTLTTYDALGRVVRTLLPTGAYSRVDYAAWSTSTWSPSDTVLTSVYRTLREGLAADAAERVAYEHAASHAETPVVTYVDARGVACATRAVGDATAADAWTRQVLDVEGKPLALIDARGLAAFTYVRDLRGRVLAQTSMDAGPAWALADAYDRAVWAWDARGFAVERGFDLADRPTTVQVRDGDGGTPMDHRVETYRYGDEDSDRAAAAAVNALGRLVEARDGAGIGRVMSYDPAGAMRSHERQLRSTMNDTPNWSGTEAVDAETLSMGAQTDALGREVWTQLVDGTERRATYERGGSLVSVRVTTPDGALVDAPIVEGLARDAHGRVAAGTLGNGCVQTWAYDAQTGRLVAQDAVLGSTVLQGLRLTYDPDGKVVREVDLAQEGAAALVPGAVSARRDHRYDAHGRLVWSTGRVHQALLPHDGPTTAGCIHGARHLSLNNGAALERYTQQFTYDVGGNLSRVQHAGTTASWATDLWVAADSNRSTPALDANGVPVVGPAAMFDAGGNLRELWHLRSMDWNWRGCLARAVTIARPSGPVDDGEVYAYGADRVRVRKVAHRLVIGGTSPVVERREVTYLGGGQERIRTYRNDVLVLERWTTHVSDGDRRVAIIDRHTVDTLAHEVDSIGPARVRYHLTTPQGSTSLELDESGNLISYEEYLPHGGSAFIAGDDARDVARRDVRYAGKERDRATGLHAYPQRYYAPWLGRWLSPDPIGPEDGLNLYAFVGGDPIGYIDPEGTDGLLFDRLPKLKTPESPATESSSTAASTSTSSSVADGPVTAKASVALKHFGDFVRQGGEKWHLEISNNALDQDRDHRISAPELARLESLSLPVIGNLQEKIGRADWQMMMAAHGGAGYTVDQEVAQLFPEPIRARLMGEESRINLTDTSHPDFGRDDQINLRPSVGFDPPSSTRRVDSKAAYQRGIKRYQDPRRLVDTAKVAGAVAFPVATAAIVAGNSGLNAAEATSGNKWVFGRDLTEAEVDRRGRAAFAGFIEAGFIAIGAGEFNVKDVVKDLLATRVAARAAGALEANGTRIATEGAIVDPSAPIAKASPAKVVGSDVASVVSTRDVVAARPVEAVAMLPDGRPVVPTARGGNLYHGTSELAPDVVFEHGLPSRGTDLRLLEHVESRGNSAFRGTTDMIMTPDGNGGAGVWAGEGGWVYQLDGTPSWDVNLLLEGRVRLPDGSFRGNLMSGEIERVIPARVAPERILGAFSIVEKNGRLRPGTFVVNPRYRPLDK